MIKKEKISIQGWCNNLNSQIHRPIFLENFLLPDNKKHCKAFTSIDLIEDTENAIEEFKKLPADIFSNRSTLYIYGVLQALYCQQDALQHLYESIFGSNFKDFQAFINHLTNWDYICKIRAARNEIAGHPTNRKNGKEFYFIAKGGNSKYNFVYGGYKPEFKSVKVDLQEFILKQKEFTYTVLDCVGKEIEYKLMLHKSKFKNQKLVDKVSSLNYSVQLIFRGIFNNHPSASMGHKEVTDVLSDINKSLSERYSNEIPDSIRDIFRIVNHILYKIDNWIQNSELIGNKDAEIFMDSLTKQLEELEDILKEIDDEYEK